jgi:hypothetical protein
MTDRISTIVAFLTDVERLKLVYNGAQGTGPIHAGGDGRLIRGLPRQSRVLSPGTMM